MALVKGKRKRVDVGNVNSWDTLKDYIEAEDAETLNSKVNVAFPVSKSAIMRSQGALRNNVPTHASPAPIAIKQTIDFDLRTVDLACIYSNLEAPPAVEERSLTALSMAFGVVAKVCAAVGVARVTADAMFNDNLYKVVATGFTYVSPVWYIPMLAAPAVTYAGKLVYDRYGKVERPLWSKCQDLYIALCVKAGIKAGSNPRLSYISYYETKFGYNLDEYSGIPSAFLHIYNTNGPLLKARYDETPEEGQALMLTEEVKNLFQSPLSSYVLFVTRLPRLSLEFGVLYTMMYFASDDPFYAKVTFHFSQLILKALSPDNFKNAAYSLIVTQFCLSDRTEYAMKVNTLLVDGVLDPDKTEISLDSIAVDVTKHLAKGLDEEARRFKMPRLNKILVTSV